MNPDMNNGDENWYGSKNDLGINYILRLEKKRLVLKDET